MWLPVSVKLSPPRIFSRGSEQCCPLTDPLLYLPLSLSLNPCRHSPLPSPAHFFLMSHFNLVSSDPHFGPSSKRLQLSSSRLNGTPPKKHLFVDFLVVSADPKYPEQEEIGGYPPHRHISTLL